MSTNQCFGDGACLIQSGENSYIKDLTIRCNINCQPVKCPNYIICGTLYPERILMCHGGSCMNCNITFGSKKNWRGQLQFQENTECPICFETKLCVKGLNCNHYTCIDCFKRAHRPPYWNDPRPQFPYDSELQDDYECNQEDPKWMNDPLIQKYEDDLDRWEDERKAREESESYLKKCPLCRQ